GPVGAILYTNRWRKKIEQKSIMYPQKNINVLGCSVRGTASVAFYQALVELEDRLDRWEEELGNTRYFVEQMEKISDGGIIQIGGKPKMHDLVYFETPILYEIGKKHRKKGYFLYSELKKRGIMGIKPGRTKGFKASVYGLSRSQINHVINSFKEIISE
ncbi:O-phospho-L-seryl-tRNA:Cys-tRNA synthase, partial [Candidatus Dojkabacteria bacterium]|nr:O-phospho-L-seryl-tRNA:Cys-tRNA synthase [Candidatus Dojkabacteria bacterium]